MAAPKRKARPAPEPEDIPEPDGEFEDTFGHDDDLLMEGDELELSFETYSGSGRGKKHRPPMMVKVRVTAQEPMRMSEAFSLMRRGIRSRIVPRGISIDYVDWSRTGVRGRVNSGEYMGSNAVGALADMAPALTHEQTDVRIERIS